MYYLNQWIWSAPHPSGTKQGTVGWSLKILAEVCLIFIFALIVGLIIYMDTTSRSYMRIGHLSIA